MRNKASFVIIAVSLAAFVLLAVFYPYMLDFNIRASELAQSLISPSFTVFMIVVTTAGEWYAYVAAGLTLLIIPKTRMPVGLPAAIALIASAALNKAIKHLFALPRPDVNRLITQDGYTFPSGHAMNGTAFYILCAILLFGILKSKKVKILTVVTISLFLLMLGFSRVYLGVHYTTDVAAGHMCGIALATSAALIFKRIRIWKKVML